MGWELFFDLGGVVGGVLGCYLKGFILVDGYK